MINIKTINTEGMGELSFFEELKDIEFEIKRIYFITKVRRGVRRGGHAHKELKQLLFCPYGKILIKLNDGYEEREIVLDCPEKGLIVENRIWREMLWLEDESVLCVAANSYYNPDDYIRDYEEYIKTIEKGEV